ncbi:cupredoxin domain-containing protein [Leisingera sp. ANG-DT]|uniref:cupredoxin domain-containing protein n=1 Tax=Leisingera sp. ANG-DT TaxID=1577897 RepID=UPI0005809FDB|nr:cupredoxin family copper-binding protein [Leisingera sp. ANG-DT]KIC18150.1 copper-binding protein [Leisingera sp. ANG-DT]
MQLTRRRLIAAGGLTAAAAALPAAAAPTVRVRIRKFAFDPKTVSIKAGQRVEWVNEDIAPHTATEDNHLWDTGELERNGSATLTFDTPGTYAYFCAFHPKMKAQVIVTA